MKILHVLTKLFCSVSLFGWLLAGSHLEGQTFTQLHSLSAAEGSPITGRLILATADGNFYGTAQQGGNNGTGTFFRITPAGAFTVLHSFGSNVGEGNYPYAGLVQGSDGNFYGTTTSPSTIFKITPGGTLTTLYTLGAADGATPFGALVEGTNGTFYGTTYVGGAEADGTVFKVTTDGTPAGTTFTSLHSFPTQSGGMNVGGANPTAGMVSSGDGNFIGTTFSGGANSRGTIFKITPAGDFTTLYEFTVATGGECRGKFVRDSSGVFYGTSTTGLGQGAVFQVVTDGTAAGTQVSVLYNFSTLPDDSDGAALGSGVAIDSEGDLYGMTDLGGANSNGTLFRLTPNGPLTTLHAFSSSTTEAQVHAGVIFGSGGILYGSTKTTIFKFEPGSSAPPPPVHGGMSDTVFKVKKLPPVTPGGDSVLHFSALQTGTPEGLKVTVQSNNVADNNRNDWVDLNNGSAGYMTVDKTTQKFVLSSTNYPLANGIYFRALSTASAYPDSKSNIVGPFNLSGTQNHLGFTTLFVATNGPGQEMNFRGSVAVDQATITLYIQATTTPDNDASWVGLNDGRAGQMHPYADPLRFYLDTTSYPPGDPVYFRAVAKAVGFVDGISNV
ncbi:MAG: choice-of-anchor tandem repeat GloVer-containing protein, partial [Chthoniobacterales bacterium]